MIEIGPRHESQENFPSKTREVPHPPFLSPLASVVLFPTGTVQVRAAAAQRDPSKRIVITGMGLCSVFGNDPDKFYERLLAGESGVDTISRFDPADFPTRFGGQIKDFDTEGLIDAKNARRLDDCLKYDAPKFPTFPLPLLPQPFSLHLSPFANTIQHRFPQVHSGLR